MYQVKFTQTAITDLRKLDRRYQLSVKKAIDRLSQNPKVGMPLKGKLKGLWKLRFSRYRIIYQILEKILIIVIFEVKHRKNVYQ
ncbi:type II toxin-antitoxin system RelE/ParE family toxin [Candidatus Gottesmanbacteria bacterium]|nr:type II toxin-antitoxin system RelE/ParE family toxin [Candidatus Gottesmanbacteria bacterium]